MDGMHTGRKDLGESDRDIPGRETAGKDESSALSPVCAGLGTSAKAAAADLPGKGEVEPSRRKEESL